MRDANNAMLPLDYSREKLPTLNEAALNERQPFISSLYNGVRVNHAIYPPLVHPAEQCDCEAPAFTDVVFYMNDSFEKFATPTLFVDFLTAPFELAGCCFADTSTTRQWRIGDLLVGCDVEGFPAIQPNCESSTCCALGRPQPPTEPCKDGDKDSPGPHINHGEVRLGGPMNWNGDKLLGIPDFSVSTVAVDLDYFPNIGDPRFNRHTPGEIMRGQNDWPIVVEHLRPPMYFPPIGDRGVRGVCGFTLEKIEYMAEHFANPDVPYICPPDLNGDGEINMIDLFEMLSNWNTAGPGAYLAEPMNIVDVNDLFTLLSAWGPCN